MNNTRFLLASAWLALSAAAAPVPLLENGGFENGATGWRLVSHASATLAVNEVVFRTGKFGLTLIDESATRFPCAMSPNYPSAPGRVYQLKFWARTFTRGAFGGVSVRFLDTAGRIAGDPQVAHSQVSDTDGLWQSYDLTVTAPPGTATVAIYVHTYSGQHGTIDFDDIEFFDLSDMPLPAAAPTSVSNVAPAPASAPAPLAQSGAKGLYIVIKADDLAGYSGGVHPRWEKFASHLVGRGIKSSIGIVTNSLENENPAYFAWVKKHHASGLIEFWHHGHDHRQWKVNGADVYEFKGTDVAHQRAHLQLGQRLAQSRLGFVFTTFGAPFNVTDAHTATVLAEDSDLTVWLYGDKTAPAGKLILDRDWGVNIENPLFVPSLEKFAAGYAKTSGSRRYYVIQGHPAQWDDARFENFTRIIDFLVAQEARFVTPSELAAALRN